MLRQSVVCCALSLSTGCGSPPPPPPASPRPVAASTAGLPPVAPLAEGLDEEVRCGVFSSNELTEGGELLDDRLRVMFVPGSTQQGDLAAARYLVERGGQELFVGARETYQLGDAAFARRASQKATFGGGFVPRKIDGNVEVIAGFAKVPEPDHVYAHGWLLDRDRNVIDVAVSTSTEVVREQPEQCNKFAQKIFAALKLGPRRLYYGGGEQTQKVSYATFHYRLPDDWLVVHSMGIHDFARILFQRRGVFAVSGGAAVHLALDSHPGDWSTPGRETGKRSGRLLDMKVSWHLTEDDPLLGAWTISDGVEQHDHAVGSITAYSIEDRDEAVRFAESVTVSR